MLETLWIWNDTTENQLKLQANFWLWQNLQTQFDYDIGNGQLEWALYHWHGPIGPHNKAWLYGTLIGEKRHFEDNLEIEF